MVAFPCGKLAEEADEHFHESLSKRGKVLPQWLVEHRQAPYPSVDSVLATIAAESAKHHRVFDTTVFYSENIRVTRLVRWAALRSEWLFVAIDVLAGLLAPLIRQPNEANSYRAVIVVKFR